MAEVSHADWKLFTERVPAWQERYMEKLLKEYAEILAGSEQASTRFWTLKERIDADRKSVGVGLCLRKQTILADLCAMARDGVIAMEDLEGFSEDLILDVTPYLNDK